MSPADPAMRCVRLHGAGDLRVESIRRHPAVAADEVRLRIEAVGLCGSDLHLFQSGGIGGISGTAPFIPGHEFMGTVTAAGAGARGGDNELLLPGRRVAVDPQIPCRRCRWCEAGDTNLCPEHRFLGLHPTDGALCEHLVVPARNCFSLPDPMSDGAGALLETLGVALHALDLAKLRVGHACAVIGCGPVGLLLVRLAHLAGARPLLAVDPLPWRVRQAERWGATHGIVGRAEDCAREIQAATNGRGCDRVLEAAWAGAAVGAAATAASPGGRVVLVGIPADDALALEHSVARRKGLSLVFSRRMKQTYPRAIALASGPAPRVDLDALVTHTFALAETPAAFALNLRYGDGVVKALVQPSR